MWANQWEILLVDDEPDVITVSKLAMQNFEVYGLPLVIHSTGSKAEALDWLKRRPDRYSPRIAVAFVDVVMESDSAGLELCQAIREELGNRLLQIFVRTGQPGVAPERQVIDRYDINGYFTKAEATEDKLYSLVKSGVRQYYWSLLSQMAVPFLNSVISASGSREQLGMQFQQVMERASPRNSSGYKACYTADDATLVLRGWEQPEADALIRKLDQMPATPLSPEGDKYAIDEDGHILITVGPRADRAQINALISTQFTPPIDTVRVVHGVFAGLGMAWQQAK